MDSAVSPPTGRVRPIATLALLGALVFGVAVFSIELSMETHGIAPIWLTNAVAVSLLLRRTGNAFGAGLLVSLAAMIAANLVTRPVAVPALILPVINVAEIAGIVLGMRALVGRGSPLSDLARFAGLAAAAAGLSAIAAAIMMGLVADQAGPLVLRTWFLSDLLGLLILVPPAIGVTRDALRRLAEPAAAAVAIGCAALAAAVTLVVFSQQPYPLLFTVLPCLILATYALGHTGAALTNTVVVVVAIGMTAIGRGPIAFRIADPYAQSLLLQFFLALNAVVVFPLAAIVTQRSRLVASLRDGNRLLKLAEELAGVGHSRLDLVGGELFWSDEVYAIYGLKPGTVPTPELALAAYHADDRDRVVRVIDHAIAAAQPYRYQARLVRPGGEVRWVEASGQVEAVNGQVVGVFGVFQDVTTQVESERTLIRARQDAEEALLAKSVFTATMSHEIRTPLTGVLAAAELLGEDNSPADRGRYLETLRQSGKLLSSIIDDVLVFARLDEGAVDLEREKLDLTELAAGVVTAFEASAAAKGLGLRFAGPGASARVLGDAARIQRVLANLVSNAIKFTDAGSITVSLAREGEGWQFAIADTGGGVPPAVRERIFEPFVQADAATERHRGGTGLGLAICRHLVEAMGGRIRVDGNAQGGATFSFTLPLPSAQPGDATAVSIGGEGDPPPILEILVAEDNGTNRFLLERLLEGLGQIVTAVENGADALAAVAGRRDRPFDLVLMDVQMPVMDGMDATRAIRALAGPAAATPICAITADDTFQQRQAMEAAGFDEVLAKPIRSDALTGVLRAFGPARAAPDDVLDGERLRMLEATLGRAGRDRLLTLLVDDAVERPRAMRRSLADGHLAQVSLDAHALKGAASIVGADRLVASLQALIDGARVGAINNAMMTAVEDGAAAVVRAARTQLQAA